MEFWQLSMIIGKIRKLDYNKNIKQAFQDTKQDKNIYNVLPSTMNSSLEKKKRKKKHHHDKSRSHKSVCKIFTNHEIHKTPIIWKEHGVKTHK